MSRSNEPPSHLEFPVSPEGAWPPAGRAGLLAGPAAGSGGVMNKVKLMVAIGLYMATLLWAYVTVVSPEFAYEGFTVRWPGVVPMLWLITLSLLPCLLLPYSMSRPSALILWWLYLSVYIPAMLVPALSLSMPFERLLPLHISLLLCMGFLCFASSGRLLAVRQVTMSPSLFWSVFLLVWGICLGYVCVTARVSMLMNNLTSYLGGASEYTIRSAYRDLSLEAGRPLGYVVGQLAQGLDPFLIAFGLVYRRRMCLAAGIISQVIIFSLTGFKGVLFSSLFLALVAGLMRRWSRSFGMALTSVFIVTVLLSTTVDRVRDQVRLTQIFTRRTLLVPGLLTGFYFEHYSQVPPVGIGLHFTHDEAVLTPPNAIGLAYWNDAEVNANANLWAEGFAELGLLGIGIFTLLAGFVMWIYDSISANRNQVVAVLLVAMPAVGLSNTSPLTMLVTHGGLVAALVFYLSPSPEPAPGLDAELAPEESPLLSSGTSV